MADQGGENGVQSQSLEILRHQVEGLKSEDEGWDDLGGTTERTDFDGTAQLCTDLEIRQRLSLSGCSYWRVQMPQKQEAI